MQATPSTHNWFRRGRIFAHALGYAEAELLGASFITFVHLEDRAATCAELDRLTRGEPTLGFEHRFRCQGGAYRWLAWTAVPTPEGWA